MYQVPSADCCLQSNNLFFLAIYATVTFRESNLYTPGLKFQVTWPRSWGFVELVLIDTFGHIFSYCYQHIFFL